MKNNEEKTSEERAILELMERLGPDLAEAPGPGEEAAGTPDEVRRSYLETLGALGAAGPRVTPPAQIKERLMAQVRGESGTLKPPATVLAVARIAALERRSRWMVRIAAALAIALLGLAAWQFRRLENQRHTIANLEAQLDSLRVEQVELASARGLLTDLRQRLTMVTTTGAEFCLLKPYGAQPSHPGARGTLVVSSDRSGWYLRVAGLEPCAGGRIYHLWFVTDGGTLRAATFDGMPSGAEMELSEGDAVPVELRAVKVTLESGPDSPGPTGEPILYADEAMQLL